MGAAGSGSGETNPDNSCRQCPSRTLFPTPNQHILRRPRHLPPIPSRAPPIDVTLSRLRKQNSTRSSHTTPWPGRGVEGGMSPEEQGGGMGLDEFESDRWILRVRAVSEWKLEQFPRKFYAKRLTPAHFLALILGIAVHIVSEGYGPAQPRPHSCTRSASRRVLQQTASPPPPPLKQETYRSGVLLCCCLRCGHCAAILRRVPARFHHR